MSNTKKINIKAFHPDLIPPNSANMNNPNQGGGKIVIIGKPNAGKSVLINWLLYQKKDIFPVGMVMNGSEAENHQYAKTMFPSTFVYNEYHEDKLADFIRRQKLAKEYISNPWAVLILDDCTDDRNIFNTELMIGLYKRGRHQKLLFLLSLQYANDVKPNIKTCIDGTFIMREPSIKLRKILWENYASIIPDFSMFCEIMDQITNDYTALYIHNNTTSNQMEDCIFWCKAEQIDPNFKFGCKEYWDFHHERYNQEYVDPL